jgi:Leucine-rich repeat (LRR) protein
LTLSKTSVTTTELYSSGLPNPTLTLFDMRYLNLRCLEDGLFDGSQLVNNIQFQNNKLEFFDPRLLFTLTNLRSFYLSFNKIDRIPHNFLKHNDKIERFALTGNKISFLPKNLLKGHTTITALSFKDNIINKVPDGFFDGLINLSILHLNYNKLETIDYNLFQGLAKLKSLFLDGNPLTTKMNGSQLLSDIHSVCGCTITTFEF